MASKTAVRQLCKAARDGALDQVQSMLASDPTLALATVSAPPKKDDGQTALQVALKSGRFEVADALIGAGADVCFMERESANAWRAPVLHDAIRACFQSGRPARGLRTLDGVLAGGADPNQEDSYGNLPLGRAMLDAKSMLHVGEALRAHFPCIFARLLEAGADPDRATARRPPVDASSRGFQAHRFLVEAQGATTAWQPEVWADRAGAAVPTEGRDAAGRTPAMTAAIFGAAHALDALLARGPDLAAVDARGWSALAYSWWSLELSARLLAAGADPNQPIGGGPETPFSRSFFKKDLARLMLAHGADPRTTNATGKTFHELHG